jgi:hypothetical protein
MPTAFGIHGRNHFQLLLNVNGNSDVGNTRGKVLIFVVVVLINIILVLNSPPPPQKKGLQHRAISSQCYHIHLHRLNDVWFWQHGDHCPHRLTHTAKRVTPQSQRSVSASGLPACQPEIFSCGNIKQWECLHFIFSPLTTQKPTPDTGSRLHIETLRTGLRTTLVWLQQYIAQESA